jgi:hypothetical protein
MKFIVITADSFLESEARKGFHPEDTCLCFSDWAEALEACDEADLLFVDLIATLSEPHKVSGYERFAMAKMSHAIASTVPLVLIAPPEDYDMDFMTGWPGFVFGHVRRPVTFKVFRRASTWV